MADINHISKKTDKQFLFEVNLIKLEDNTGKLEATDVNNSIKVAIPPKFGGGGNEWSPEHLFLSAIISCYMATFFSFAKKLELLFTHFKCNGIGQIEIIEGKYKFTNINVYPKIFIEDEAERKKAVLIVEKTEKYCLIGNSINAHVIYHTQVINQENLIA